MNMSLEPGTGEYKIIIDKNVKKPNKQEPNFIVPKELPKIAYLSYGILPSVKVDININCIHLVNKPERLEEMIAEIETSYENGPLFFSVEEHRVFTYKPFACLLMIMIPSHIVFAIDVIELRKNLSPLYLFLKNSKALKVFYDASHDISLLRESLGLYCGCVFCLKVLFHGNSFESALKSIDIQTRRAIVDWRIRPITKDMSSIALNAVAYLPLLMDKGIKMSKKSSEELINIMSEFSNIRQQIPITNVQTEASEIISQYGETDIDKVIIVCKKREQYSFHNDISKHLFLSNRGVHYLVKNCTQSESSLLENDVFSSYFRPYLNEFLSIINKSEQTGKWVRKMEI